MEWNKEPAKDPTEDFSDKLGQDRISSDLVDLWAFKAHGPLRA